MQTASSSMIVTVKRADGGSESASPSPSYCSASCFPPKPCHWAAGPAYPCSPPLSSTWLAHAHDHPSAPDLLLCFTTPLVCSQRCSAAAPATIPPNGLLTVTAHAGRLGPPPHRRWPSRWGCPASKPCARWPASWTAACPTTPALRGAVGPGLPSSCASSPCRCCPPAPPAAHRGLAPPRLAQGCGGVSEGRQVL